MVDISLIVPVSPDAVNSDLELLLQSITDQTLQNIEALIVVNSVPNMFVPENSHIRLIILPGRQGATAARNYAAKYAKAEILGFLDDDVILDSKWCEYAVSSFNDGSVGGVSGRTKVPLRRYGLTYIPQELLWVVGGTYWEGDDIRPVLGAAGMNFCVRKKIFAQVGGYDEGLGPAGDRPEVNRWFRLGAEEDDLALKIRASCRKKVMFNPKMIVKHRLRRESVLPIGLVKRSLHVGQNRAYIHSKHPSVGSSNTHAMLRKVTRTTIVTAVSLPLHPLNSWMKLSFTCIVTFGLVIGYSFGLLRFRFSSN
ncbi:MAG: glycosyltransferase family 2 protein [Nitrososphaerota archaeon]|nr:glycosyltransferase family 2 protein [Nitrososphaerota archaeon]